MAAALFAFVANAQPALGQVDYPIVYLAYPRDPAGGFFRTSRVDENGGLDDYHRGTSLKMRRPDGVIETLIEGEQPDKGFIAVHSFGVGFDGQTLFVSILREFPEALFGDQAVFGVWADIYRFNVQTRQLVQLTNAKAEWDPPRGSNNWVKTIPRNNSDANKLFNKHIAIGTVWNTTPVQVAGGRVVFASTRRSYRSPHNGSFVAPLLYAMNAADGKNVDLIGSLSLGGAADPDVDPKTGRVVFSSGEQMGLRGNGGNGWAIWSINPDGTGFGPEVSALPALEKNPLHFQAHTSDGSLVYAEYYDVRVYGALRVVPPHTPTLEAPTKFGTPVTTGNPKYFFSFSSNGSHKEYRRMSFQPRGIYPNPATFGSQDWQMYNLNGELVGMASHPFALPNNGLGFTWTGNQGDSQMNLGIYMIPNVQTIVEHPSGFIKLVDLPDEHEWLAKALVSYSRIYGKSEPPLPKAPIAEELPPGSAYGVIGTSGVWHNEIVTPDGKALEAASSDREGLVNQAEFAVIYGFNPTLHYSARRTWDANIDARRFLYVNNNTEGYNSAINERMGTFTTLVPLKKYRKPDGGIWYGPNPPAGSQIIRRADGQIDTSFRAIVPGDYPWTIGLATADGNSIAGSIAQTWHHVRPREKRTDCGGCHAHHQPDRTPFGQTFAASAEYTPPKLDKVEFTVYERDIAPIVARCQLPWGADVWNKPNGEPAPPPFRTTETDIDDHPCLTAAERLAIRKWIRTGFLSSSRFSPKFETGNAILPEHGVGVYSDTSHPSLNIEVTSARISIGAADPHTGINTDSLSVKASFTVRDRAPGSELSDLFIYNAQNELWTLDTKVPPNAELDVSIRDRQVARDGHGNVVSENGNITRRVISFAEPFVEIAPPKNLRVVGHGFFTSGPQPLGREAAATKAEKDPFSWVPAWLR